MNTAFIIFLIILLLPLIGGIANHSRLGSEGKGWISTSFLGISFVLSLLLVIKVLDEPIVVQFSWMPSIQLGWNIDRISSSLIALVTFISFLVHLFSVYYMEEEEGKSRYFLKLGLFTSSMIGLLGADHLILLFIFWELVGFTSYLLIGFWYQEKSNAESARVAFITNRVADVLLLSGIVLVLLELPSGFLSSFQSSSYDGSVMVTSGFLIVFGAFGKSAQFPFYNWLVRAMAGPTPVSALIHAATMVAAGVYLLVRTNVILAPVVKDFVAVIGGITLLIAALSALTQWDIKKVLAYSTVSQLGYMMFAVGVGASEMALFHLWTHAFFKAGLFLAAGAIIHELHRSNPDIDPQDIRSMGGLKTKLPFTYITFLIFAMSLMGLPFFTGFFSKEAILLSGIQWSIGNETWTWVFSSMTIMGVFLTAFYMIRLTLIVFLGKSRITISELNENVLTVRIPLLILAIGSLWVFYHINPLSHSFSIVRFWFGTSHYQPPTSTIITVMSLVMIVAGAGFSTLYRRKFEEQMSKGYGTFGSMLLEAFYLDRFYMKVIAPIWNYLGIIIFKIDSKVIDPAINWSGMGFVVLSKLLDIMDKVIVDNIVNCTARVSAFVGEVVRLFHARRVQLHVFWVIVAMFIILVWVNFFEYS